MLPIINNNGSPPQVLELCLCSNERPMMMMTQPPECKSKKSCHAISLFGQDNISSSCWRRIHWKIADHLPAKNKQQRSLTYTYHDPPPSPSSIGIMYHIRNYNTQLLPPPHPNPTKNPPPSSIGITYCIRSTKTTPYRATKGIGIMYCIRFTKTTAKHHCYIYSHPTHLRIVIMYH